MKQKQHLETGATTADVHVPVMPGAAGRGQVGHVADTHVRAAHDVTDIPDLVVHDATDTPDPVRHGGTDVPDPAGHDKTGIRGRVAPDTTADHGQAAAEQVLTKMAGLHSPAYHDLKIDDILRTRPRRAFSSIEVRSSSIPNTREA